MRWPLLSENASSLHNGQVGMPIDEDVVRAAAIEGGRQRTLDGRVPITHTALANDFCVGGSRFPLDRPRAWDSQAAQLVVRWWAPFGDVGLWFMSEPVAVSRDTPSLIPAGLPRSAVQAVSLGLACSHLLHRVLFPNPFPTTAPVAPDQLRASIEGLGAIGNRLEFAQSSRRQLICSASSRYLSRILMIRRRRAATR
jgi:hypothetical protein